MFETAQPQAGETANQPEDIVSPDENYGGNITENPEEGHVREGPDEPFMTIRYNKELKPLSKEEAIAYAQKGMNYDKLQGRLKETAAKLSEYESLHPANGEGLSETEKQGVIDAQLESFMHSYPQVDPRKLPENIIDLWKKGVPLSEAYLKHQAQQLDAKIKGMKKAAAQDKVNRMNAAASMGAAISNGNTRGRQINDDAIRGMTSEELEKNHERIWAYLTKGQGG